MSKEIYMYKVSIIVSIYNIENYIDRCINSLINQNSSCYEILLIDDGSTDSSSNICKYYSQKHDFIKYFYKKNGGVSSARNLGIEKSSGEYLWFIDGDDYIESDILGDILFIANMNNLDMLYLPFRTIDYTNGVGGKVNLLNNIEYDRVYKNSEWLNKFGFNPVVWSYLFKSEFIKSNNLFFCIGIYHEDTDFMPRSIVKCDKIMAYNALVYNYCIRKGSLTNTYEKNKIYDHITVANRLNDFKKDVRYDSCIFNFINNRICYSYISFIKLCILNKVKLHEVFKYDPYLRIDIYRKLIMSKNLRYTLTGFCIKLKIYFILEESINLFMRRIK